MPPKFKRKFSDAGVVDHARCSLSPPPTRRKTAHVHPDINTTSEAVTDPDTLRIYSWNVNGVGPLLQKQLSFHSSAVFPIRTFLKRHSWPAILCLQEVKIASRDILTQSRFSAAVNAGAEAFEPRYVVEFSLPRDKYNATGFGGKVHGVASLIRDDIVAAENVRTYRPDWDLEGRVLVHELPNLKLTVVNGYWVNGTSNLYRDSKTGEVSGTRHDHKLHFHSHMLNLAMDIQGCGQHVVLLGDMNVARERIDGHPNLRTSPDQHVRNRADFNKKFFTDEHGLKGVDVYRMLHGKKRKYTYHPRGIPWGASCDRVDIIITNSRLHEMGALVSTDICDNAQDRGHSDHVPLWVALHASMLRSCRENSEQSK